MVDKVSRHDVAEGVATIKQPKPRVRYCRELKAYLIYTRPVGLTGEFAPLPVCYLYGGTIEQAWDHFNKVRFDDENQASC